MTSQQTLKAFLIIKTEKADIADCDIVDIVGKSESGGRFLFKKYKKNNNNVQVSYKLSADNVLVQCN